MRLVALATRICTSASTSTSTSTSATTHAAVRSREAKLATLGKQDVAALPQPTLCLRDAETVRKTVVHDDREGRQSRGIKHVSSIRGPDNQRALIDVLSDLVYTRQAARYGCERYRMRGEARCIG